jgi:hypothetical protein
MHVKDNPSSRTTTSPGQIHRFYSQYKSVENRLDHLKFPQARHAQRKVPPALLGSVWWPNRSPSRSMDGRVDLLTKPESSKRNTLSHQVLMHDEPDVLSSLLSSNPDPAAVISAWPRLSREMRAGIIAMVTATEG